MVFLVLLPPAYFSVTIPSGDRSLLQLQHQVSQEIDQYLNQLTDEEKDKQVSEQILARASCFITERWKMTRMYLNLSIRVREVKELSKSDRQLKKVERK